MGLSGAFPLLTSFILLLLFLILFEVLYCASTFPFVFLRAPPFSRPQGELLQWTERRGFTLPLFAPSPFNTCCGSPLLELHP